MSDINLPNPTIPIDYLEFWENHAGIKPKYVIHIDKGYIVWIDDEGDVDWQTTEALDAEIDATIPVEQQNAVHNHAAYVNTLPVEHLTEDQRRNFRIMIGSGFARLFTMDAKCAMEMMQHAEIFVKSRNAEIARGWQVVSVVVPALLAAAIFLVLWCFRESGIKILGQLGFTLCLGFCGGSIGAAFSVLSRSSVISLDPSAGKMLHFVEGVSRSLAGSVGAVIAQLAVKLSILLGLLDKGTAALFFVALIAGVSERLVPALIRNIENDAETTKKDS